MDSNAPFDLVFSAFRSSELRHSDSRVIHATGDLPLSQSGEALLREIFRRTSSENLSLAEAALLQLISFYLLDRGRLAPAIDYSSLVADAPGYLQPAEVSLEITKLCNLSCVHCYNDSGERDAYELEESEKLALASYLVRWGVRRLTLTGGEPTLDSAFESLLSLAKEHGVSVKVTTNGWSVPSALLSAVEDGSVVQVSLSVDGADEETHDAFRGRSGSFRRVLAAMKSFSECRPRRLQLNVSVHRDSLSQMEALAKLALAHDFDSVSFKPVTSGGRPGGRTDFFLSLDDIRRFRVERARLDSELGQRIQIEGNLLGGAEGAELDRIGCNAAHRSMLILSTGAMTPCDALGAASWAPNFRELSPMRAWMTHPLFHGFRAMKGGAESHVGCPGLRFRSATVERSGRHLTILP